MRSCIDCDFFSIRDDKHTCEKNKFKPINARMPAVLENNHKDLAHVLSSYLEHQAFTCLYYKEYDEINEVNVSKQVFSLDYDDVDTNFFFNGSQQFATVIFTRSEDEEKAKITVIYDDSTIKQFWGDNRYNPSARRRASCVYAIDEPAEDLARNKIIKICVVQHKGTTYTEIHEVSTEEFFYLFNDFDRIRRNFL